MLCLIRDRLPVAAAVQLFAAYEIALRSTTGVYISLHQAGCSLYLSGRI